MNAIQIIKNGIVKENPTFVLMLGMCPTLATTTSAMNGMSMGLATMAVLICTNFVISCLKSVTPDKVRIPVFIVVIAAFVTILQMVIKAFLPDSNLKYIITYLICKSPNKLRGYYDEELSNISEISKSIGFANIARNVDERVWYINCALVLVYEIKRDFVILARLNILTDKDLSNKSKSLIKGIIAQLIGWRDYTIAEGVESRRSDKSQS